ncbi:MAG TPA: hypothetical protein VNM14_16165 [Planctomycetota bacterium]|nr:hypothetical protein [Planctomycetota bacterium]
MKRASFWAIVGAAALLGPACGSWVKIPDHHVTVLAVDRLNKGEEFTFTVNVSTLSGQPLKKWDYQYKIDWVGAESGPYKGKSGILEKIRVKGEKGSATLHILGYDAKDQFGEIARHEFVVQ